MEIGTAVGVAVGTSTIITFGLTKLWDAYRMEKKFRTKSAAEACMKAREQAEGDIKTILRRMEKRMQLGNLAISDLWDRAGLPRSKLARYEKDLDIKLRDNGE